MVEPLDRLRLSDQLKKLRERQGLADEGRLARTAPLLLQLAERVLDLAGAEERAIIPQALRLLEDALHDLSPASQEILKAGLNWDRDPMSKRKEGRLRALADRWEYNESRPIEERERELYLPLADALLEQVSIMRRRKAHEAMVDGDGDQTAATLFVAKTFGHCFRIFSPISGVGYDLEAYLIYRWRNPAASPDILLDTAIWQYARMLRRVDEFVVSDLGGNWIASDADTETEIVTHLDMLQRLLPFSDQDCSSLRIALVQAPEQEFQPFRANLRQAKLDRRFRQRLKNWVQKCDCNVRRPKKKCEPHQAIGAAREFCILIEREWYRLSNWYHLPAGAVSAERNKVIDYFLRADPENYNLAHLDRSDTP
ncbi:hypothetical protein AAH991_29795 [Microbispora sp. ZYX-F-249]|uniref:DUF2786 domain-containing protein n=1 Tax=Microbispora maris TaxID=3144104 RepID=A0ABV0AVR0_9ACTN